MNKSKLVTIVLILALILAIFAGCQAQNAEIPTDPTEPSASSQPTDPTEPSSEATDPTESAVCPRTVEYFKSHLTPYMTYREAIEILGRSDKDISNIPDEAIRIWYLEEDYCIIVEFFPIANQYRHEYLATEPTGETTPDGGVSMEYFIEWNLHMEAYRAILHKELSPAVYQPIEVWFDNGYGPFWQEEEGA